MAIWESTFFALPSERSYESPVVDGPTWQNPKLQDIADAVSPIFRNRPSSVDTIWTFGDLTTKIYVICADDSVLECAIRIDLRNNIPEVATRLLQLCCAFREIGLKIVSKHGGAIGCSLPAIQNLLTLRKDEYGKRVANLGGVRNRRS